MKYWPNPARNPALAPQCLRSPNGKPARNLLERTQERPLHLPGNRRSTARRQIPDTPRKRQVTRGSPFRSGDHAPSTGRSGGDPGHHQRKGFRIYAKPFLLASTAVPALEPESGGGPLRLMRNPRKYLSKRGRFIGYSGMPVSCEASNLTTSTLPTFFWASASFIQSPDARAATWER